MKVLLLTVTAGHGHTQAAKAVMEYLQEYKVECALLDTLDYINPILGESVDKGYLYSTRFTPNVWGKIYNLADSRDKSDGKFSISHIMNKLLSKKLISFWTTISRMCGLYLYIYYSDYVIWVREPLIKVLGL